MCYPEGSVQHAVNVCPMCKVFPHPNRCPHMREVCRNRSLHPRADYLFLTNAEVETFNGCGYCKWARSDPPTKASGMNNPGWPGCCRPPASNEYRMIPAADWRSVSIVHGVSLPPEIKSALDILSPPKVSTSALASPPSSMKNSKSVVPPLDRRNSGSPPSRSLASSKSSAAASTSSKARPGGSPKQSAASLSGSMSRATGSAAGLATTTPEQSARRSIDASEKSGSRSAHSSPSRKQLDLDNQITPRRNSGGRTSTSTTTSPTSPSAKTVGERSSVTSDRRRATISATHPPNSIRNSTTTASSPLPKSSQKDTGNMSSGSSNNGSDDRSSDSMSDSTITSDGGFTDYLSDESEAELQRQAEARAALLAQNQAEEMEFKAARQRLAHIDLNPPKSWNPTNITNNTNVPRLAPTGKV
ncbi:hypothetical protein L218DRAFT_959066 [Marasmius fiardii PR-910]|nr:hypothetical protein L218DRAFT_959066 [Marasmius fiardii PR-910]